MKKTRKKFSLLKTNRKNHLLILAHCCFRYIFLQTLQNINLNEVTSIKFQTIFNRLHECLYAKRSSQNCSTTKNAQPLYFLVNLLCLAPLSQILIYGPDLGVWPDNWVSAEFFRATIPRKGSGSTTTTISTNRKAFQSQAIHAVMNKK